MRKCNVCGNRFRPLAKNRYEIANRPAGITRYYAAFDCPYCGCQYLVQKFDKAQNKKVNDDEMRTRMEKGLDFDGDWEDFYNKEERFDDPVSLQQEKMNTMPVDTQ